MKAPAMLMIAVLLLVGGCRTNEDCKATEPCPAGASVKDAGASFAPAPDPLGPPKVVNSWVVFGRRDWLEAGENGAGVPVCLTDGVEIMPTGVSAVNGKPLEPEAAAALPRAPSYTYTVADGASMRMRFGHDKAWPMGIRGTLALADPQAAINGKSARPVGLDLTLTAVGAVISVKLDKSSPFNVLFTDVWGRGTLRFAATIDSQSRSMTSSWFMGGTFFFVLPVRVSDDFRCVTLAMTRDRPGSEYTPVEPYMLEAADGP